MVDVSDAAIKKMLGKPWSAWNLPGCSTEIDSVKLREIHKPKIPDRPKDHCNLLPFALKQLYGTKPETEYFSVTKCPACKCVMKSQWMSTHFKRDAFNSLVCRRTEMIVNGSRCLGKATTPLYEIRESTKDPLLDFAPLTPGTKAPSPDIPMFPLTPQPRPARHRQHSSSSSPLKTEHSSSHNSKSKSHSSSKSDSHSKKHSSSNISSNSSSSKHKSSSKGILSSSSTSSSFSHSKKEKEFSHSKSHKDKDKSHSTGSYMLSIPSDDSHNHDSVESILNSSKTTHFITGKSKASEPEYEQLKFYADSSEKRKTSDSSHKSLHFSSHLENFKIPLKNKSSSNIGTTSSESKSKDKSKSHGRDHSHSSKSSHEASNSGKLSHRHNSSVTVSKPVPSLTIISEPPRMNNSIIPLVINHIVTVELPKELPKEPSKELPKEKSHSKKKKKKKDRDEPRKIIPLKERAFNPDQHCGVSATEEAPPCTRSLTCKTHSIALRRAVPGRSHGFDSLLAAHKKARDEEKAKLKTTEDSKPKAKKHTGTVLPLDSDSSSSSLPQPPVTFSLGKANSISSSTKSQGQQGSTIIPVAATASLHSSHAKHTVSNNSSSKPGVSGSHQPAPTSHRQQSKIAPPATKASIANRPLIIVDEKKEPIGLSLFEIVREPENNYTYISSIDAPKKGNVKGIEVGKNSRINALSEWNPLDRFSRRGSNLKKKGFKDPLVPLFPRSKSADTTLIKKEIQNSLPDATIDAIDSKSSAILQAAMKRKESLRRKCSSMEDVSIPTKKSRVSSPYKLFESMLLRSPRKRDRICKAVQTSPEKLRPLEPIMEDHMPPGVKKEVDIQKIYKSFFNDIRFHDPIPIEAVRFARDLITSYCDNKEGVDIDKLSPVELCQLAVNTYLTKYDLS